MIIEITHIPTGETVRVEDEDGSEWLWTDGNYGCDCNRFLFFERAKGNDPDMDDCPPCGEILYSVKLP